MNDYVASEDVYAYYLQGTYRAGPFPAIAGARHESTDPYLYRLNNERNVVSFKDRYSHLMPSVHLRYDITPDISARASWNNTVGRHDTGDMIYGGVTINRNGTNPTNPALDNYLAKYSQWDWTFSYDLTSHFQLYGGRTGRILGAEGCLRSLGANRGWNPPAGA